MKQYKVTFFKDLEEKDKFSKGRLIVLTSLVGNDVIKVVVNNNHIYFVGNKRRRIHLYNPKTQTKRKPKEALETTLGIEILE